MVITKQSFFIRVPVASTPMNDLTETVIVPPFPFVCWTDVVFFSLVEQESTCHINHSFPIASSTMVSSFAFLFL